MNSKKLKVSIFFLIIFILFVGAKPHKKVFHRKKQTKKVVISPFQKLKKEYLVYKNSPQDEKSVNVYKSYIIKFEKFSKSAKEDEQLLSNYYIADINEKLYELTGDKSYLNNAFEIYLRLSKYNNSYGLAAQKKVELNKGKLKKYEGNNKEEAVLVQNNEEKARLVDIKYEGKDDYTQVTIELNRECNFEHNYLKADLENNKPQRIIIDFKDTTYSHIEQLETQIANDNILDKIRVGQYNKDTLRVVLDLKTFYDYDAILLKEPFRVVVHLYNGKKKDKKERKEAILNSSRLANFDKLPYKLIVIDMGHGAHDPGAIGYNGLKEKDVTLDIGLKLGRIIKENFPQIEVVYTRTDDTYLTLDERTALANKKKADMFISIHANASKNKDAHGVETYFLNFTKEHRAKEVVARENASTLEGVDEVQEILKDLIVSSKYNESSLLAMSIQKNLVNKIRFEYQEVNDLGVKQGPFYVLLGAAMPSVLVETSFITNPTEGKRLADENYRSKLAEGIFEGIKEYIMKSTFASSK